MTNGDLLAMLRDDGPLRWLIVAGIVIASLLVIWGAAAAIRRIRANRQPKRTQAEARLIGNLRAEGYLMAGLSREEWNAYLTDHKLQPKRDRVDRLVDDALADDTDDLTSDLRWFGRGECP